MLSSSVQSKRQQSEGGVHHIVEPNCQTEPPRIVPSFPPRFPLVPVTRTLLRRITYSFTSAAWQTRKPNSRTRHEPNVRSASTSSPVLPTGCRSDSLILRTPLTDWCSSWHHLHKLN